MNYIKNGVISLLLVQFLKLSLVSAKLVQKEEILPVSSPIQLKCENNLRVGNIDVTIRRTNTTCSTTTGGCTLPIHAIETINETCNNEVACDVDIRNITNSLQCLQDNGYYNVWYTCRTITDFSCNFDSDLCSWTPVQSHTRYRWTYGFRIDDRFPAVDHTSASTAGKYAYIYARSSKRNDIAHLEIEHIIPTDQQCLSFWYFTTNSRDKVYLLHNDLKMLDLSDYDGKQWQHIQVPLEKTSYNSYKLVFKVIRGKNSDGSFGAIAIDDILIANQNCDTYLFECDFDTNDCDWKDYDLSNQYVWKRINSETHSFFWPETDHTTASESGYYMHLNSNQKVNIDDETTAFLEFHNVDVTILENSCFTFWCYMHVYGAVGLNVTLDDELVWTIFVDQNDKWKKGMIDLHKRNLNNIKFIGILGNGWIGDIAIDDLYITEGTCKGLFDHEEICVHLEEGISKETFCPRGYLDFTNPRLSFDPEKEECSKTYNQTKLRILQECRYRNNSQKCLIDLSTDISSHPECFQVYQFRILHTCEDEISTTVSSDITSRGDSSAAVETTTVSSFTPSVGSSEVSVESVTLSRVMKNSSDSATGLVVGLVIGGLLLACAVIFIVVLFRRHTLKSRPREKLRNNLGGNDYIGSQDIVLPQTSNHSSHMQNDGMYDRLGSRNTSVHGYERTQINNVQQKYTSVGAANGFVNKDGVQTPTYAVRRDKTFADNHMPNDDEYAIDDPTAETSFNETIDNRTGTADSYMVLDPTETGFNRQIFSNTPVGYEFAKPVKDTENKICDEDQYDLSDEGVYDHSGSNRHKESEDNIYNHAVDTIYDSGSHKRNNEGREDTYDHFFGQTTEFDYDISTTT